MIIGIDHGNKQIKTANCQPFISGLQESTTKPYGKNVLEYQGLYYTLTDQRIPYHKDKSEDDRFFLLTLFAIAGEIEARKCYSREVLHLRLAIGVPPAYFGFQGKTLTDYFRNREIIKFTYHGKPFAVYIEDVLCFPQAYAAAIMLLQRLRESPKVVILDIGGHTADYMVMKHGRPIFNSVSACDSLENGVDVLYNRVRSALNAEKDILLDESEIDAILLERRMDYGPEIIESVERQAENFVSDLFSTLRERQIDLRSGKTVFVGGGSILLRRQIEASGKAGTVYFVEDIKANARGYEFLYRIENPER